MGLFCNWIEHQYQLPFCKFLNALSLLSSCLWDQCTHVYVAIVQQFMEHLSFTLLQQLLNVPCDYCPTVSWTTVHYTLASLCGLSKCLWGYCKTYYFCCHFILQCHGTKLLCCRLILQFWHFMYIHEYGPKLLCVI